MTSKIEKITSDLYKQGKITLAEALAIRGAVEMIHSLNGTTEGDRFTRIHGTISMDGIADLGKLN
jgi:hypothetical protein